MCRISFKKCGGLRYRVISIIWSIEHGLAVASLWAVYLSHVEFLYHSEHYSGYTLHGDTLHNVHMLSVSGVHCKNKGVMVTPILGVKWLCENDTTFGVSNAGHPRLVS